MENKVPRSSAEEYHDSEIQSLKTKFLDEAHEVTWKIIKGPLVTAHNNVVIDVRSDRYFDTMTVHAALDQLLKEQGLDLPLAGLYSNEHIYPVANSFDSSSMSDLIAYMEQLYSQKQSLLLVTRLGNIDRQNLNNHIGLVWPIEFSLIETKFLPIHSERIFANPEP